MATRRRSTPPGQAERSVAPKKDEAKKPTTKLCTRVVTCQKSKLHVYTLKYDDTSMYVGGIHLESRQRHGQGVFYAAHGDVLDGQWKDDRFHGFGSRDFAATRDRHEGMYHKDKRHGRGTYLWANGDKYIGMFYNGRMHGDGALLSASTGDVFEGTWVKGVISHGTKRFSNGDSLRGAASASTWNADGTLTGEGVKVYRNGNEYRGRFERSVQSGFGTFQWSHTGNVYAGMWAANAMDGYGRLEYTPPVSSDQDSGRHVYVGAFVKGEFHGHGRVEYASGDVYEGAFVRNRRHGRGVFRGRWDMYEGMWEDNHPQGVGCYIGDHLSYHGQWVSGWPQGCGMYTCRVSGSRRRVQMHQGQCALDSTLRLNPLILLD